MTDLEVIIGCEIIYIFYSTKMSLNEVSNRYYTINRLMETIAARMPISGDVKVATTRVYENEFSNSAVIVVIEVNGTLQSLTTLFEDNLIKYLQIPKSTPNNFDANKRGHVVTIHPNKKSFTKKDNTLVSYYDYEVKPVSM